MHVYYLKRPGSDRWEPCSHLIACLIAKGLQQAPHLYDGWATGTKLVTDLAEHHLQAVS